MEDDFALRYVRIYPVVNSRAELVWQAFVLTHGAICLAANEAGFSRIADGQYAIFSVLRRELSFKKLQSIKC